MGLRPTGWLTASHWAAVSQPVQYGVLGIQGGTLYSKYTVLFTLHSVQYTVGCIVQYAYVYTRATQRGVYSTMYECTLYIRTSSVETSSLVWEMRVPPTHLCPLYSVKILSHWVAPKVTQLSTVHWTHVCARHPRLQ